MMLISALYLQVTQSNYLLLKFYIHHVDARSYFYLGTNTFFNFTVGSFVKIELFG